MNIGRIEGATRVLGKSQGYIGLPLRDEAKNLGDLPHMLHVMEDSKVTGANTPTMQTVWHPTPDEMAAIAAGAPIYLTLVGIAHPPVQLIVGSIPEGAEEFTHGHALFDDAYWKGYNTAIGEAGDAP